jgi:hypothetical protein
LTSAEGRTFLYKFSQRLIRGCVDTGFGVPACGKASLQSKTRSPIQDLPARGFIVLFEGGGTMRSMTFCAAILSFMIATAVASAQTPSPSAATPGASPTAKQATSKACSDQADAKGLHGKARKKFRTQCKKRAGAPQ